MEDCARRIGNAIFNSALVGAFPDQHFVLQHPRDVETCNTGAVACFVTHGEDSRVELIEIGVEFMTVACSQACVNGSRGGAKLVVEGDGGRVG